MIETNESPDETQKRGTETHNVRYDPGSNWNPSELLVTAVADIADEDPLTLTPLYETIDPDTLDDFVAAGGSAEFGGRLAFGYEGHEVTVYANGLFEIELAD